MLTRIVTLIAVGLCGILLQALLSLPFALLYKKLTNHYRSPAGPAALSLPLLLRDTALLALLGFLAAWILMRLVRAPRLGITLAQGYLILYLGFALVMSFIQYQPASLLAVVLIGTGSALGSLAASYWWPGE